MQESEQSEQSGQSRTLVHISLIPIRWGDMDAYRHVNNTVYFQYMEQARAEFLVSLGCAIEPKGRAPVIINACCTFLQPLTYPAMVEVSMFLGPPGNSSLPSSYEIRVQGSDTLYASGESKLVWMDMATEKSAPIPEDIRVRLAAFASSSTPEISC